MLRTILVGVVLVVLGLGVLATVGLFIAARTVGRPTDLGATNGALAACPDVPNCVSSQAQNPAQLLPPIPYTGDTAGAQARLLQVLRAQPRVEVIEETPTYIATVFRSATMQFPDDVEFLFDEQAGLIHFRSASRLGEADMGVNRARMELISREFAAQS